MCRGVEVGAEGVLGGSPLEVKPKRFLLRLIPIWFGACEAGLTC